MNQTLVDAGIQGIPESLLIAGDSVLQNPLAPLNEKRGSDRLWQNGKRVQNDFTGLTSPS